MGERANAFDDDAFKSLKQCLKEEKDKWIRYCKYKKGWSFCKGIVASALKRVDQR